MIAIRDIEQGTPEWDALRVGIPTSSNFDKLITTKGDQSKQRLKYMYKLAGESVTGTKEGGYQNEHMTRGIEMEAEARKLYELISGEVVETVALCYRDERKLFACSPDGLVGEDGGVEIKCPSMAVHVSYLLGNKLPTEYIQQVLGTLYITGRKWWDFVSYYPGMRLLVVRVYPDAAFSIALEKELETLCAELQTVIDKIK